MALLARINLDEDEKKSLLAEFDSILAYVDQLKKVGVATNAEGRVGAVKNVFRPDEVESTDEVQRQALLNEVPDRIEDFVAVKKIIEQ